MNFENFYNTINTNIAFISNNSFTVKEKDIFYKLVLEACYSFKPQNQIEYSKGMHILSNLVQMQELVPLQDKIKKLILRNSKNLLDEIKTEKKFERELHSVEKEENEAIKAIEKSLEYLKLKQHFNHLHFVYSQDGMDKSLCYHMTNGETDQLDLSKWDFKKIISKSLKIAYHITEKFYKPH
jgi:DNA integrity scanning protein DisA with diadenylate cyclase activity